MKISIFIIRYKETEYFYKLLDSIKNENNPNVNIYVINNFGKLVLPEKYNRVVVLNNNTRPDFSTGHLARNWNESIINGFGDLNNPLVDRVIGVQADTMLEDNWYETICNLPKEIEFLTAGRGDEFQMFTVAGIKKVGLYDERFCNIGYQEGDYFLRNVIRNPNNTSINDQRHGRVFNKFSINPYDIIKKVHYAVTNDNVLSVEYHPVSRAWFNKKYINRCDGNWTDVFPEITTPENKMYPYFEQNIESKIYE